MRIRRQPGTPLPPLYRRRPSALYVHVPFCLRRCPYCDFAVVAKEPGLERAYLEALAVELRALPPGFAPRTVYVGGGTPSELSTAGIDRLAGALEESCDLSRVRELSIEANPGTFARKKLDALGRLGVTRVSLGAQSFREGVLATLGRTHRPEDAARAVRALRDAGVAQVNLDLIFGVPGETDDDVRRDLEEALALEPDHVSTYGLTFEAGTELARARREGRVRPLSKRSVARQFRLLRRGLRAAGFLHYEVSNFARPGRACAHNRVYWRNGAYHGAGCSAASHLRGARSVNVRDARAYVQAIRERGAPGARAETERLLPDAKARETAWLALRTSRGISRAVFLRDLGVDPFALFAEALERLESLGLVKREGDRARLTGRGVVLADGVAREIL